MQQTLLVLQIILAIMISAMVLLQAQGSGLGSTWGGGGETYYTRRGVEKMIFYSTIIAIGVFIIVSVLSLRY
ncbi:MAG: preprotein translocase subunit SecG [Candidatus Pacebacteria bacterium]|nr:preprotein translocase subunit SecG [Candidatus Paceibacterota bacterium]